MGNIKYKELLKLKLKIKLIGWCILVLNVINNIKLKNIYEVFEEV